MTDLKWLFKKYMADLRIDDFKALAKMCGIDYSTFKRRLQHPENFRVFEIKAINEILHFTPEDLQIILGNEN